MRMLALGILIVLVPAAARAADRPLAPGDTIRVTSVGMPTFVEGTLVSADGESLTLRRDKRTVVFPVDNIRVAVKTKSSRAAAAGWGALILGGTTFMATAAHYDWDGQGLYLYSAYGMIAACGGALIGFALPTTSWRDVDPKRLRVAIAPVRRGAQVQLRVSF